MTNLERLERLERLGGEVASVCGQRMTRGVMRLDRDASEPPLMLGSKSQGVWFMSGVHSFRNLVGDFDPSSLGDPVRELLPFRQCETAYDVRALLREQVETDVAAMLNALTDADAFDVIELMRMREFSIGPDPRLAPPGGASLPVEIVAAILLARPSRKPDPAPREASRPHEVIQDLHERCLRLARMASYRQLAEGQLAQHPLGRLASEYQGAVLNIRNLQYDHIRDDHDGRLFETAVTREIMLAHLGYTYGDVAAVRSALNEISADRITRLRNETGELLLAHQHLHPRDVPEEVMERFMEGMIPFMFLPADRSVITTTDVASATGLDVGQAQKVLMSFSQPFDDSASPAARVFELLMGNNPFLTRPLMTDGAESFAMTSNLIGSDVLRRIFERALPPNSPDVRRYDKKARQPVSEELAKTYIEHVLGAPAYRFGYHYLAPKPGTKAEALGVGCQTPQRLADDVEGDALFLVDDVAIVVEVKGKSIADQSRRGDLRRLTNDLKATIGDGARQATRLRDLIEANGGFWETPTTWLDLSRVREVRTVVVVLDDIGPLGTDLVDLQRAEILPEDRPPLVLSLHDLAVIAEIGERPSEFLLYLRRRTDSPVISHYRALDELDLYMLFLDANLYVEDDPDTVKSAHPAVPPVTDRDRRQYEASAIGTMVSDTSADLTIWMNRNDLPDAEEVVKPTMNAPIEMLAIIDQLRAAGEPGWFRCGADLLALSGVSQQRLLASVGKCVRATVSDGKYHEAMSAYAGTWGFATIFMACRPEGLSIARVKQRLERYATVKQYQLQADRAYGWVFNQDGSLGDTFYINTVSEVDPELDRLVGEMGLQPVGVRVPPVPPSARRPTKRLRGKRSG